ncbi:histidine kinase [Gemmatimonas aurantiaca]|uniref:sensor histidine kinase n=1 Tax=Gemmatimonas aurantiaca TaxID=173480 RepID=UPI00301BE550
MNAGPATGRLVSGRSEWPLRAALAGFWLLPAIMGTIGFRLVPSRLNPELPTWALFLSQLAMWGTWGVWTALIWYVGDRVPFRAGERLRALAIHILLAAVVVVVQIFVQARVSVAFGLAEPRGFESTLVVGIRSAGDVFLVIFCAIVIAQMALRWYGQWQTERLLAARMGEDLAQAQLRALQAQLNPHFLFNALNSIVTLIGRDPALAQQLVVRLADLLRAALKAGDGQEIPLAQELEFTRRYLDIELVRFADRLQVEWPDEPLPAAIVPAFALQPLVENALLHGIARQTTPGIVSIDARHDGGVLMLRVRDTGPGLVTEGNGALRSRGTGTGLANLRTRLERLYGAAAALTVQGGVEGGVEATLRIPFRAVDAAVSVAADAGNGTQRMTVGASGMPAMR